METHYKHNLNWLEVNNSRIIPANGVTKRHALIFAALLAIMAASIYLLISLSLDSSVLSHCVAKSNNSISGCLYLMDY